MAAESIIINQADLSVPDFTPRTSGCVRQRHLPAQEQHDAGGGRRL